MKIFVLLILTLACLFSVCKKSPEDLRKKIPDLTSDNRGVIVKGYDSIGYIHNTNEFPVRVRKVKLYGHFGAITIWLREFQPGEKLEQYIQGGWPYYSYGEAFYIYDMNGVLTGFIVPTKQ